MYYITVSNGLLTKEHKKKMGSAVWEFMWCLDKMTAIDKSGKGVVLGGKPVQLHEIGMGHDNTTSRNMQKLEDAGYIKTTRTPYGMVIYINKPKKRFTKNGESLKPVNHQKLESPTGNGESPTKNGDYKEDTTVDTTEDNNATGVASPSQRIKKDPNEPLSCVQFVESCKKSPCKHIQIIGEWAEAENPKNATRAEWESFIRRNLRAAKNLNAFEIGKIEKAYQLMLKDVARTEKGKRVGFLTKYTLETVGKYIDLV